MTLQQAIKEGRRLVVAIDYGVERLAAQVYVVQTGIVFLDLGWPEPLAPPRAHYMAGPIEGDGPWKVGDWRIRELDQDDPDETQEWQRWEENRRQAEEYGLATDRAAGAEYARREIGIDVRP